MGNLLKFLPLLLSLPFIAQAAIAPTPLPLSSLVVIFGSPLFLLAVLMILSHFVLKNMWWGLLIYVFGGIITCFIFNAETSNLVDFLKIFILWPLALIL
ncbi:MAG: hypothetical protein KGZ30_00995 [Anaplasmataceae bacterium]|nr:hypothetical protein [Anaplasmataceae bacterium]